MKKTTESIFASVGEKVFHPDGINIWSICFLDQGIGVWCGGRLVKGPPPHLQRIMGLWPQSLRCSGHSPICSDKDGASPVCSYWTGSQGSATAMNLECGDGKDSTSTTCGCVHSTGDLAIFFPTPECLFHILKIQSRDEKEIDQNVINFCLPAVHWSTRVPNLLALCSDCLSAIILQIINNETYSVKAGWIYIFKYIYLYI